MSDAKTTALAIVPRTIDEVSDLAERFSKSTLLAKSMQGKPADVLVTIMAGQEMGLSPMASLRAIHVIDGKPVLSADGMIALVLGSGKAKYFTRVAESDTSVTYETCRVGTDVPRRCTWTWQMAKDAGLSLKDNWRLYKRQMLASRAKSELARDVYPDVLMGCYTDDEIGQTASAPASAPAMHVSTTTNTDVIDAEIVSEGDAPAELAAIDKAETQQQLDELAPKLAALPDQWKQVARDRWSQRSQKLKGDASKGAA